CDTIVAATDASREGEMLFRYLYRFLGCRKPCLRLWISLSKLLSDNLSIYQAIARLVGII
ncbi:hypothetical protein, partial [Alistipes putredinis]|uniref:hypothetical protein n=1 Tax=Alistipes putredinis TaxID=28117 RepID=UPI003AB7C778